jgi:hypothetical protein
MILASMTVAIARCGVKIVFRFPLCCSTRCPFITNANEM